MVKVCVILADGEIDIVQEEGTDLDAHVLELQDMGCRVTMRTFDTHELAEAFVDSLNDY